ncbi:hypothetical protein [Azospirillum thermophilum]|uniref:Nif11 domain-containing protein n=1 Tax=Azospirillum thermophilum TaxID=2202148 RepID=A0A2S2CWK3_9PROT|nr:hypothetical protein [Azospirillum thermophilum]AWK88780.1 hypothetical protein DEW08_22135 [Azospirillum thermophilum]
MTTTAESLARFKALATEKPGLFEPLKGATNSTAAAEMMTRIAADNGLDIPAETFRQELDAFIEKGTELSDSELDSVAGGFSISWPAPFRWLGMPSETRI